MARDSQVLLVQPPYLRLYGSHNNRVPLELCYLHRFLTERGVPSAVLNLDKTDATVSIPWSRLYENTHLIDSFFSGDTPAVDESIERILSYQPEVVAISGGDSLTPWADLGNPYVAALLSRRLRSYAIYTVGVGPFFGRVPHRFQADFDALLTGIASPSICDMVLSRPTGVHTGLPLPTSATPLIDFADERDVANVVMTSVGCPLSCNFCMGASTGSRALAIAAVIADIQSRTSRLIEIGDAIFPVGNARMAEMEAAFADLDRDLVCETSVSTCHASKLERLVAVGVRHVKIGIESGSDTQLREMGKRQTVADIERAVRDAKSVGLQVTGYVLLGGHQGKQRAQETLRLSKRLNLDDLVVNVLSHFDIGNRDFSRDAHWSAALAEFWNVDDVMPLFFGMQAHEKAGIGRLLPRPR